MIPRKPSKPVSDRWTDLEPREKRKVRPRRPMHKQGVSQRAKERRSWDKELKEWWKNKINITYCEIRFAGCRGSFGFALAHSKKRRFILSKKDYFEVVGSCQFCHSVLDEKMSHKDMERIVKEIIEKREAQP